MVAVVRRTCATTIVMERQRRSLDLVFSAPVAPPTTCRQRRLRCTAISDAADPSLPVTAACVVLGGASWSDVLTSTACSDPWAAFCRDRVADVDDLVEAGGGGSLDLCRGRGYLMASTSLGAVYSFRSMMGGGGEFRSL